MSEKRKQNASVLPDRQLARVFAFSADDFAANQAGYLSKKQHGDWLARLFIGKNRLPIEKLCGRSHLIHERREVRWQFHMEYAELFAVQFAPYQIRFALNAAQYKALYPNLLYDVYYHKGRIMSLARRMKDCDDA